MKPTVGEVKTKKNKSGIYQLLNFEISLPKVSKQEKTFIVVSKLLKKLQDTVDGTVITCFLNYQQFFKEIRV